MGQTPRWSSSWGVRKKNDNGGGLLFVFFQFPGEDHIHVPPAFESLRMVIFIGASSDSKLIAGDVRKGAKRVPGSYIR